MKLLSGIYCTEFYLYLAMLSLLFSYESRIYVSLSNQNAAKQSNTITI